MTNDSMTVMQAVQQVGDEDLLRQLAEVALAKLMAFEVDGLVGAAKGIVNLLNCRRYSPVMGGAFGD